MKARWFFLLAIICFALGWILPYILISMDAQNAEGWEGVWWLIVAPTVYSYLTYVLWAIGFILLIAGIVVYRKRRRR
ncbi:MAG TPA: hypothetical protein ENI53_00900 [Thermoplasmatales archaeon]|nr:hypothetical protein [Thermoplasmatales archaeon]